MSIFRQYIAPLIVVLIFLFSLVVVSARIFLPADMAAPAPVEELEQTSLKAIPDELANLPPELRKLMVGTSADSLYNSL